MGFLTLLLPIISLVSFVGYAMLVRNAFRSSTGWGLAVLFLSPFAAVFFAIKHWEEAKKPFLIYSGSAVAGMVAMVMLFASMGGFEVVALANDVRNGEVTEEQAAGFIQGQMDRMEASGMLDAEGEAGLDRMREAMAEITGEAGDDPAAMGAGSSMDSATSRPRISEPEELVNPAVVEALKSRAQETARENRLNPAGPIRVAHADRYVGRKVTAVGTDGIEHSGTLSASSADALWLEQYFSGGTFAVELRKSQIRSLEVLER